MDVRIVAATSRDLGSLVESGRFRADLYFRLRGMQVRIPALRERGDDWELILQHELQEVARDRPRKTFSGDAIAFLRGYRWPGNVRELKSLVDTGYHLSAADVIERDDFTAALEPAGRSGLGERCEAASLCARLVAREGSFWQLVHDPYMGRDLNRREVREIVRIGLEGARGSYKRLLSTFGMEACEYTRFMDFLRHHQLKPGEQRR